MSLLNRFRRGLIIPKNVKETSNGLSFDPDLAVQESFNLRMACLYFDRAAHPKNNIIELGYAHEQYARLKEIEFIQEVMIQTDSWSSGNGSFYKFSKDTFDYLNKTNMGRWSIANICLPETDDLVKEPNCLRLELVEMFPIPDENVDLEGVLRFNAQNRAHLLKFRSSIIRMSERIISSPNPNVVLDSVKDELELALHNIESCSRRSGIKTTMSNFELGLSLPQAAISLLLSGLGVPAGVGEFRGHNTN